MDRSEQWLAEHRALGTGKLDYRAAQMTDEEKRIRRNYIRRSLRNQPEWCNLHNEGIDQIIVCNLGNNGFLVEDLNGYEYVVRCKGVLKEEAEFRKVRAMIPFEFIGVTGNDFDWNKYGVDISKKKELVNNFIINYQKFAEKGLGLYIYSGTKGSGKTMLACCILNEIVKRYVGSVKFVNVLDFLEMTKKGYNGYDEDLRSLYDASLLVIDDIGVQMKKEWVDTTFYYLINDRYVNRKPTIYTSNIAVDDLKMDDRVIDRIDGSTCLINLPEVPVRKITRQHMKQELLDEIKVDSKKNAP